MKESPSKAAGTHLPPTPYLTLDTQLFVGFAVGLLLAIVFRYSAHASALRPHAVAIAYPIGIFFLRVMFLLMAPYIFFSVSFSIASLRMDDNSIGLTARLAAYYVITTIVAIAIGQFLVSLFQPGLSIPPNFFENSGLLISSATSIKLESFNDIVEPLLHFSALSKLSSGKLTLVFALSIVLGVVITWLPSKISVTCLYLLRTCKNLSEKPVEQLMRLAPAAVAALTLGAICKLENPFSSGLIVYIGVVIGGLAIQQFVVYPAILYLMADYSPREFFARARPAILASFFSCSAKLAVPLTTRTLQERFRISEKISTLSATLGANFNLDGTALFEAVAVVFLAQVFRIDFTLLDHLLLLCFVLVTSIGLPGVPGSTIPILATCLATLGIPLEGLGLIVGLDGLLIMFRSAVNTTGDMVGAVYLFQFEKRRLRSPYRGQRVATSRE